MTFHSLGSFLPTGTVLWPKHPLCAVWHSLLWSVYTLCKKYHWSLSHTLASWIRFPNSLSIFSFFVEGWINSLQAFLEGSSAISESEQLDPFSMWVLELATEEDVLVPKKERISMSSCRYLIDPPNLANCKKKKTFSIANWTDWYCSPVSCWWYTEENAESHLVVLYIFFQGVKKYCHNFGAQQILHTLLSGLDV